jgi:hypothetical protein
MPYRKIVELEDELKVVGNNMKALEIAEQEVRPFCKTKTHYLRNDFWAA